ncbi:MAG: hypothetical protein QJQ54_03510 [Mollicutes bacterium]|nr:MAG: hypothetical protein QJQ54_03510 [Mollicutes bacterium]
MKTFLHKKLRAFFLLVMLLLSLFTFLGFTPAKNNVLSDSAGSPPNDSQKTPPLPLTAPNNFSLN